MTELRAKGLIRDIRDFPQPGVIFKDITPVLADPQAMAEILAAFLDFAQKVRTEAVAGIESRGFVFGSPIAMRLGVPFIPIRKPGKLPYTTFREDYELEYGTSALEVHTDAVQPGRRVLVVDDLLATGGTAGAAVRLVQRLGASVAGMAFFIELASFNGRQKLGKTQVCTLVRVD